MSINFIQYATTVVSFSVLFYLLFLAHREKLWRHFKIFFAFTVWIIFRDASNWVVIKEWGYSSLFYYHYYYVLGSVINVFQILLLVDVYYRIKSRKDWGQWIVLLLFTAMMSWYTFNHNQSGFYLIFSTIALYFQVLFCLLIHLQLHCNRELVLGRNYEGILYGLSLMIALQSFNYGFQIFDFLPVEYFLSLAQPVAVIPWLICLFAMRKLDLPRQIGPELSAELQTTEANFRRAVRVIR